MFLCQVCPKTYKSQQALNYHRSRIHDGVKYPCTFCPQVFTRGDRRHQHEAKQHKALGIPCPKCDKFFTSEKNSRWHYQNIHEGLGYRCPTCDKSFSTKYTVRRHQQTVHKQEPSTDPPNISKLFDESCTDADSSPAVSEDNLQSTESTAPESMPEKSFRLEDYLKIWQNLDTDAVIAELIKHLPPSDVKL